MSLKPNHFNKSVLEVYDTSESPKHAINGFIGLLGKANKTKHQRYIELYYNIVANELINCDDDIHIEGIHKDNNNRSSVNLLNSNEHGLQHLIQEAHDNTHEPMLYQLPRNKEIPTYDNTLPIHRKPYDLAIMDVYELH